MTRLEQLLKLAETSPDDPLTHYAVALEYFNQERWDDARLSFERTIETDAKYTAAYYHKARAEVRAGLRDQAKSTLDAGMRCARENGDRKTEREMQELLETIG